MILGCFVFPRPSNTEHLNAMGASAGYIQRNDVKFNPRYAFIFDYKLVIMSDRH